MTILDRIDRATSGLCPCGAPPADGSAYCSDDCRPTHISDDTDTREAGHLATPMRWRPDLVGAAPDDGLTLRCGPWPVGGLIRNTYQREGTDLWHLRVDDGHRYVGCDVEHLGGGDDFARRCGDAWRRLERELVNPRHTAPIIDDPVPDCGIPTTSPHRPPRMDDATRERICAWARANNLRPERMPEDAWIVIHHATQQIEAEEFLCDEAGSIVPNGLRPQRITRRVPLIAPWTDDLFGPPVVGQITERVARRPIVAGQIVTEADLIPEVPGPDPSLFTWTRRCRACGRTSQPAAGARVRLTDPARIYSIASIHDLSADLIEDIEPCDLCAHCRTPFPGPSARRTPPPIPPRPTG